MARSIHTEEYRKLTDVLTSARREAGLTQQQVAERLGKPQSYVAKLEGNERRIDVVEFVALAKAFKMSPEKLFRNVLTKITADEKTET